MKHDEVVKQLTGPGAPFELVVESVSGRPTKNFATRQRSLREKVVAAGALGDRDFLVQGERRVSYGAFARLVWGTAARLRERGFTKGDRLAILSPNNVDWVITMFAAASLGGVVVGLNGWWVEEELAYGLAHSGSRFLVVDERLYPRVAGVLGKTPALEQVFVIGAAPPGTTPISALIADGAEPPTEPIDEDDPFVIFYTSGTTGRPKGCITTHRGTITQVMGILLQSVVGQMLGGASPLPSDGSQPAGLITSPLFHVGGLHTGLCTAMSAGAKVVFTHGRFDPERVLEVIAKERVTTWAAVPTMLHRVVTSPALGKYDVSSLTRISVGGAPLAPELLAQAKKVLSAQVGLANGYGLTETHGIVMMNGAAELAERPTSIGRPMPFFDVKIVDEEGRTVPDGTSGELLLYGPTVTPGYWDDPEATRAAVPGGWLHTGDIAYRDAAGFYHLVDRAKDVIIRGGENVYSVEIENCLAAHPKIDEAAVIGVPDAELGERVKAVVHLRPGASLTEDEVRAHVRASLAPFKVPEIVTFTAAPLPRNPAGKVLKNLLRGGAALFVEDEGGR